jgi:hypothetical protein
VDDSAGNIELEIELYLQRSVLARDEKIVWQGRPTPAASVQMGWMELFVGLFFFGFSVFWTIGAFSAGGIFGIFGIPFMAIGGWMITKPFRTKNRAKKSHYAITDRRVLIIKRDNGYSVNSIYAHEFNHYARKDHTNGTGDIRFRQSIGRTRKGEYLQSKFSDGLWGIDDVRGADLALSKLRADVSR